eukprot:822518_1
MAQSESKNNDIPLSVLDSRDESEVEANTKRAEELFQPRPTGKCCTKMWQWYWCPGRYDTTSGCCDVDHIAAHLFVLSIIGLVVAFISAYFQDYQAEKKAKQPTFEITFLIGMGTSIVMAIWGLWQISIKLFNGRLKAAKILDANNNLRKERANLDDNIRSATNVNAKLQRTNQRKKRATEALKTLFTNLNEMTGQMELISDTNKKIGAVIKDKYKNLLLKLKDELIQSEKMVIETIYNNLHLRDGEAGLDQNEFKEFVRKLPPPNGQNFKIEVGK